MSEYCAWVSPSGAMARSTATRHFVDSRHTRKPGVAFSEPLLMANTVHGDYIHGYYFLNRIETAPSDGLTSRPRRG